jgi:hypothetical protein
MTAIPVSTDGVLARLLDDADVLLRETFGVGFDFWRLGEGEGPIFLQRSTEAALYPQLRPEQFAVTPRGTGEAAVIDGSQGECLLGLPLEAGAGQPILATAAIAGEKPENVRRLARFAQKELQLRQQLQQCREELDYCADQIGSNFEELTFLRRVSDQLEMADLSHETWQVAEAVLPLLAPMIKAETLVLVAESPNAAPAAAISSGSREVDAQRCRQLVEHFRGERPGSPVVNNHVQDDPQADLFPGIRSVLLVPLVKGEQVFAWLLAINRQRQFEPDPAVPYFPLSSHEYGTAEAGLMKSVASMLATHAKNIELFREKEQLLVGIVRSMVSAIDAKDPYTCGHSERVALVARRIAEQMNLDERQRERIYLTGLLHDIGKIGVSDAILHKPGKLTEEEFAVIQRHPDQGWSILQELHQLQYELPGVLHHHENYNGTGYPDRLAGEQIPLPARIVAVADAFDAMTSDRPYRKGMPLVRVLEIFHAGNGAQWDPQALQAFFDVLPDILSLWSNYQPRTAGRRRPQDSAVPSGMPVPTPLAPAT